MFIRFVQDIMAEKRSSDHYASDENSNSGLTGKHGSHLEAIIDEEAPLISPPMGLSSRTKPS